MRLNACVIAVVLTIWAVSSPASAQELPIEIAAAPRKSKVDFLVRVVTAAAPWVFSRIEKYFTKEDDAAKRLELELPLVKALINLNTALGTYYTELDYALGKCDEEATPNRVQERIDRALDKVMSAAMDALGAVDDALDALILVDDNLAKEVKEVTAKARDRSEIESDERLEIRMPCSNELKDALNRSKRDFSDLKSETDNARRKIGSKMRGAP